jgi:hypothetical protein
MDDGLKKKSDDMKKLQEHILDDDAVVDMSHEERTVAFEEDSAEIEEVFLDSDSEERLSSTEGSSFGEEASSVEEDSESEEEEDSESEEEKENLRPLQSENGQI